ncbi:MAG TPA: tRNA pseudouridine(38-40) synthase TruA [Blastocatellia bacterium]|jgi:tRNA pseudouridine38-40 synthase|nr:tRNA pseudouridine(38-40) synthase TruA [Blastocatellia bacterium]
MKNFKITIQYDGTDYHGWQIQPNGRTIQGELTRVLSLLDHRQVTVHGAGRTDAGVHAEGQVANFFLRREFDPHDLREAINGNLDRDVRALDVEQVADSFNARFSAKLKTYRYQIWTGAVVSPFLYRYVYHYRGRLDAGEMRRAAAALTGAHDFSAFTVMHTEIEDRVRSLTRLDVDQREDSITLVAEADGFLRYMVRTIAGTLIEVGRGRREASSIAEILRSRDRANAGPTAPAAGLTLVRVGY